MTDTKIKAALDRAEQAGRQMRELKQRLQETKAFLGPLLNFDDQHPMQEAIDSLHEMEQLVRANGWLFWEETAQVSILAERLFERSAGGIEDDERRCPVAAASQDALDLAAIFVHERQLFLQQGKAKLK